MRNYNTPVRKFPYSIIKKRPEVPEKVDSQKRQAENKNPQSSTDAEKKR